MDKKQVIFNTLMGKIQNRSKSLFEDVNNEIWDFDDKKDCDITVDGEEVTTEDEENPDEVKALDVILDAPVDETPKEVSEE